MDKKIFRVISFLYPLIMAISLFIITPVESMAAELEETGRQILNFNSDWGFYRGDLDGAEAVDYNDEAFANVTIPHTMRLEQKHCNGANSTYMGIGWYRRYFTVDEMYEGKIINIDFEGVMTDSDIYLNGEKLYTRNGGYIGFSVDITDKVKYGETNVLAVRVSSVDNPNTPPGKADASLDFHYYGGIYRDVTMRITDTLYISDALQADETASGGVFITYPEVSKEEATVNVKTHVVNEGASEAVTTVISKLVDADGVVVAEAETAEERIGVNDSYQFEQTLTVTTPNLWHPDKPYLYTLVSEVYNGEELVDSVTNQAGIRTIEFKADGFYINGEKLYLRGANRHQSYQNIGDAASNSMQVRDALLMKENGFNAVRAAHYPQDPAFLAACDQVGLLVIECQPGWQQFTNTQTFWDLTIRDTREMIRRDRNHPSVVLWETSLNETGYSARWAQEAVNAAHEEYPGDQIYTASDYGLQGTYYDVCFKVQDTQWSDNPEDWVDFDPNMPFLTREWGDWETRSKALRVQGEEQMNTQIEARQEYLNGDGYSDWGGLDASDRIGGHFLWSWNDYTRGLNGQTLGSGTVDIDRYEKYCFYWLQSMQSARNEAYGPMVFIASTYSETSDLNVNVFSNCDSVKLYQNGTLIDELYRTEELKSVPNIAAKGGSPIYTFQLSQFVAGELKAEAILDGEVVCTHTVKTPETATHFEIEVRDRGILPVADGSDLIPVYIKAVDDNGTVVPDFNKTVTIEVMGEGKLVGEDIPRIKVEEQKLEAGIGFAFVRTTDLAGDITIWAFADGMDSSSKTISTVASIDAFVPEGEHTAWEGGVEKLEGEYIVYDNIAVDKPVTVSTQQGGNEADHATDDDTMTRWCASGGEYPQWIQIDLEKNAAINGFEIAWENASAVYKYDIEVSADGNNWTTVVDMGGNTEVNGAADVQLLEEHVLGRYVRMNITGCNNGWASLYEFRVIPNTEVEVEPGEVILDAAIESIIASEAVVENRDTDKLRDGVTTIGSGWLSASKEFPQSVTLKFKQAQTLYGSRIYWEKDSSWYTYNIEVSTDGETWTTALESQTVGGQHYKPETFEDIYTNVNYVRVNIENIVAGGDYQVGMAEWILYGEEYIAPAYVYVSDLDWESAHSDYGAVTKDGAVYGGLLVLNTPDGPQTFNKGLGADTNSEVVYDLNGAYGRFEAYIGINANAGKQGGEAIFKVYVDDNPEPIYTSPVKMRDDNCEFISLRVVGVDKLRLEAVWSENAANEEARYNTHVNWADAKLYYLDKETLKNAVDAELSAGLEEAHYEPDTWVVYQEALKAAQAVLNVEEADQDMLDSAWENLEEKKAGLIKLNEDVEICMALIDQIGKVSLDSEEAIMNARNAYDALREDQKMDVTNYQILLDAEHDYAVLVNVAIAEEVQRIAEEAKNRAEEAQRVSEEAQAKAEAAQKAAEKAAAEIADNKEAAEAAKAAAENAKKAAEAARNEAQAAKTAAEAAAKAAENADVSAVQKALEAAESAKNAAETANLVAGYASAAAEAQAKAQEAQAKAEAAQKESEEAAAKAEAEAEAIKKAAELAMAKQTAFIELKMYEDEVDVNTFSPIQTEAYNNVVSNAMDAIIGAEAVDSVNNILEDMKADTIEIAEAVSANRFKDVHKANWFYDDVDYVAFNGLMMGMTDTEFGSYEVLTRAQFVTILYRMEGSPSVDTTKTFEDIVGDEWYGPAVLWAAEKELVSGYANGYFGASDLITREQMAVMMYNYMKYLGKAVPADETDVDLEELYPMYKDITKVSAYAKNAVKWTIDQKIIMGKENGTLLDPQGVTTRSEAAAIIRRFISKYTK